MADPYLPADPYLLTLAPYFVGTAILLFLFGASCVQAAVYSHRYPGDSRAMRCYAALVFSVALAPAVNSVISAYLGLVRGWGDVSSILDINTAQRGSSFMEGPPVLLVQLFFAWRTHLLCLNRNITFTICLFALTGYAASFASGMQVQTINTVPEINKLRATMATWFASTVTADLIITVSIIRHLRRARTGFSSMDAFIAKTSTMALQTGLAPTVFSLLTLAFFLPASTGAVYITFILPSSAIYTNSFFYVLNSRPRRRSQARLDAEEAAARDGLALARLASPARSESSVDEPPLRAPPRINLKSSFKPGARSIKMLRRPIDGISVVSDRVQRCGSPAVLVRCDVDRRSLADEETLNDEPATPEVALGQTRHCGRQ